MRLGHDASSQKTDRRAVRGIAESGIEGSCRPARVPAPRIGDFGQPPGSGTSVRSILLGQAAAMLVREPLADEHGIRGRVARMGHPAAEAGLSRAAP